MDRYKRLLIVFIGSFFFYFLFSARVAVANEATINVSPNSGNYGKEFDVSVIINGNGQAFNAAQALVTLSPNLSLQNLSLGNCNFSFLTTPSVASPSFIGILLGKSTKTCTLYTMTLAPTAIGNATITLSNGSVRRYGDAVNILSGMQGGTYTLTSAVPKSSLLTFPAITLSNANLYSLLLTIETKDNRSVGNTLISLKSITTKSPLQGKTDSGGHIQFTNLQPGVYDATLKNYEGDTILNVNGKNHVLVLGMKVSPKGDGIPFLLIGILILGIVIGITTLVVITKRKTSIPT